MPAFPYSLTPWLNVRDSLRALDFYKNAFAAEERFRLDNEASEVVARLAIHGAEFWLSEESPGYGNFSPESILGCSVRLILSVPDPDETVARAVEAGAELVCAVTEDHGWRVGRIQDPFGHIWEIARPPQG
ncbi:VOC family protein [Silvibacterium sp.]|uniref:VOC family protein n=1 Tax=Silvibacterium sp. TaxID=1964179 RepID=UPI0039E34285